MSNPAKTLPPGFRFHPTDEELILHYLKTRAASAPCPVTIIAEVDIYKFDPWELPAKAMFGDREWYFFSPRDRKYPNGMRPNRSAASGYWKATGTDKPITTSAGNEHVGVKKALVFYKGRPPKGLKTDWIMHEYRLAEAQGSNRYKPMKLTDSSMRLDDWVLCRIYKKSSHQSVMETPLMDREHDDSGADDCYLPALQCTPPEIALKLPKSTSISDFFDDFSELSRMFDNLPEMPAPETGNPSAKLPFIGSSSNSNGIDYFVQQLTRAGSPASVAESSYLKRHRTAEEENEGRSHPSKKRNEPCNLFNQFDSPQYNMMNQYLFNQQLLLLNSHLGTQ